MISAATVKNCIVCVHAIIKEPSLPQETKRFYRREMIMLCDSTAVFLCRRRQTIVCAKAFN